MAELRRKQKLEAMRRLEEQEKKKQLLEMKKKKESRWEMTRWCHSFLEENASQWEIEKIKRIEDRKRKIEDWERKTRFEKIKILKEKIKSKNKNVKSPDTEEDDLVRLASITENNWTVWRDTEADKITTEDGMEEGEYEEDDDEQIPRESYSQVPEKDCNQVSRDKVDSNQVPRKSCQQAPEEDCEMDNSNQVSMDCNQASKENCQQVPGTGCNQVPRYEMDSNQVSRDRGDKVDQAWFVRRGLDEDKDIAK